MKTKSLAATLALIAAMTATAPAALAQPASPGIGGQAVADVHHLSNQLRDVIKNVEKAGLPCVTRNNIVRRLRLVDDALLTGNRSAAAGLLTAWIAQARSMQGAGLLSAPQGAMLQVPLGNILPQIGFGSAKNPPPIVPWPPLPKCDSTTGAGGLRALSQYEIRQPSGGSRERIAAVAPLEQPATSRYEIWQPSDARAIVEGVVSNVPLVGEVLATFVAVFWPESGAPDVSTLISDTIKSQVQAYLDGLRAAVTNFASIESASQADCATYGRNSTQCSQDAELVASTWLSMYANSFPAFEPQFRLSGHEVELLPFYAQYMNVYLAFLREGALAKDWPGGSALASLPENAIKAALNTSDTSHFIGYVNATYKMGLDQQPSPDNTAKWAVRNKYIRDNTLQVLDFRDMWPYLDPAAYPNGFPGFKLTRMIYSDPIGGGPNVSEPAYADGPLEHLTVWTRPGDASWKILKAVQFTGGPTSGPDVTSAIMGAPVSGDVTRTDFDVRPGSTRGPIVTAEGADILLFLVSYKYIATLDFTFADGCVAKFNNGFYESPYYGTNYWHSFHYDDEVVASMSAAGGADLPWAHYIIFGFRYADSFYPSGEAINAGTGLCMTASSAGGVTGVGSCSLASPNMIWTSYGPFRELRAWAGTQCLTAPSTAVGTQLITSSCAHEPSQQWTLTPGAGGGTITGMESGLVVGSANGNPALFQLQYPTGASTQKWKTFTKVQGPVQAVGAGKCLGVSSLSSGTPVQIYTCNGLTSTQTWVYSPSLQTFSFPGWTQCLTARGTAAGSLVEINACTGEASQQWREDATGAITHIQSGLVLDVLGGKTADGSPVGVSTYTGGFAQKWTWPMN